MQFSKPITEAINQRYSCRNYNDHPIEKEKRQQLNGYIRSISKGPFGNQARFELVSATERDRKALKNLGTYGFIKNAPSFIIGALRAGERNIEDYGYLMEDIILFATDLGLGTCWLGGTFTKSSFSRKISARDDELVPAVVSVGEIAKDIRFVERVRPRKPREERRLPWENLFFNGGFGKKLTPEDAGEFFVPLEMIRIGPSASNKQPWRIVKQGGNWHFFLQHTPGYNERIINRLFTVTDIQRLDIGIAMCHFEGAARELGLRGGWVVEEPGIIKPDELTVYTVTWRVE